MRLPFALLGVLLVLSSVAFAGSLAEPTVTDPAVDRAVDRTTAEIQTALRGAVRDAATDAAQNPIVTRADTPFGAVLNRSETFRDGVRVRTYLAARDRFSRLDGRTDGLSVRVSLPSATTPKRLRVAKRRVAVERLEQGNGSMRVTVENVTLTVRREGRTVAQRVLSPTITVRTPTLAVHDRVERFEKRLNGGPTEPGLGRRLTARLYALAWTRGYAQYAGTPIANVIANRHVGLFTNGVVLALQRAHFGESDPRGRSVFGAAAANVGLTDAVDGAGYPLTDRLSKLHDRAELDRLPAELLTDAQSEASKTRPDTDIQIEIDDAADAAFRRSLANLTRALRRAYTVDVERRVAVEQRGSERIRRADRPESDWRLEEKHTSVGADVTERSASEPNVDGPGHLLTHRPVWVTRTRTVTRDWNTTDGSATTVDRVRTRYAVDIRLVGRHDSEIAPERPITPIHEPGGVLDGPNLASIEEKAIQALLGDETSVEEIARRGAAGDHEPKTASVTGERPAGLDRRAYASLTALRERVRNLSVENEWGDVATLDRNPPAQLARKLADRRPELVDAPFRYDGVAERAATRVRVAYVEQIASALERRSKQYRAGQDAVRETLRDRGSHSLETVQSARSAREGKETGAGGYDGVEMRLRTAPSYLTLGALDGDAPGVPNGRTEHPLVARNRNFFTLPYGEVADSIVSGLLGPDRANLATAARTLRLVQQTDESDTTPERVRALRSSVSSANAHVTGRARQALAAASVGTEQSRRAVVRRGLSRWTTPGARGEALANGSVARAIQEVAVDRWSLSTRQRERVKLVVRHAIERARSDTAARPPQPIVHDGVKRLRKAVSRELSSKAGTLIRERAVRTLDKATKRSITKLPAGLPLVGLPGAWYATVNVWDIQVRGEYARFAVTVPRGTPDTTGARLRYVRDGDPIAIDVDADGNGERLGRATRVRFRTRSTVAVAVPPGVQGVGDKDGTADERSPGWPFPGPNRPTQSNGSEPSR